MYSDWSVLAAVAAAVLVWQAVLTLLVWKQGTFLKSLFPKSGERDIRKKFEEVLSSIEEFKGDLSETQKALENLVRVEIVRYNPYGDTGGDQSFSIALLSEKGSGVVLTSLHARTATRLFAKPVTEGKSKYRLSKEEEEVIKKALKNNV